MYIELSTHSACERICSMCSKVVIKSYLHRLPIKYIHIEWGFSLAKVVAAKLKSTNGQNISDIAPQNNLDNQCTHKVFQLLLSTGSAFLTPMSGGVNQ
jgi:hypothetical protein